jgi:membrane fusion protein, multidrug efflux system
MPILFSSCTLRRITIFITLALTLGACTNDSDQQQTGQDWAPMVTVITAQKTSADVKQVYAGRLRGAREVEVRTRVPGILEERLHEEGRAVKKGEPLFRIDQKPYAVALQAARAEQQRAEADLSQAQREWERVSRLYEQDAISRREHDQALSALELAQARRALAQAHRAQAQLEFDYTRVEAPLSGITSLEVLPEGSLVERGTLLTTIVQHDPIHVHFALPEQDAALQREPRATSAASDNRDLRRTAHLQLADGTPYEHSGEIDFTAATVDARTGTISARAVFSNPASRLIPGQFVRVGVHLQSFEDIILVPEVAVVQGPEGPSLYIVNEDNTAELRRVRLGPLVEGGQVVLEGVEQGERVVINGQVGLRPGMSVTLQAAAQEENR